MRPRLTAAAARLRRAARRYAPRLSGLVRQLAHVRVMESATVLAAEAFLTIGPVLLAVSAFASEGVRSQLRASLRTVFGLQGAALEEVRQVLNAGHGEVRQAYGVVSILILVVSATSLSRALQQTCERCWHVRHSGLRVAAWRWLPWLCVLLAVLLGEATIQSGLGAGAPGAIPLSFAAGALLWWWTQHLLLGGQIGWRPLLPGALLASADTVVIFWASRLPAAVRVRPAGMGQ